MNRDPLRMTIRSKVFISPGKGKQWYIIALNICLIIVVISSLIGFFAGGFNPVALIGIAGPFVIVRNYKDRPTSQQRYESCLIDLVLDDEKIRISYNDKKLQKVEFQYSNIQSLEYSDQLVCLRIFGVGTWSNGTQQSGNTKEAEHFLYLEKDGVESTLYKIKLYSKLNVRYVDRQSPVN